jgi:Na+/melibiose symporter-like transporter
VLDAIVGLLFGRWLENRYPNYRRFTRFVGWGIVGLFALLLVTILVWSAFN